MVDKGGLLTNDSEQGDWAVNDSVTHRTKAIHLLLGTASLIDLNLFTSTFITAAQLSLLSGKSWHFLLPLGQGMVLWECWHPWGVVLGDFL